MPFDDHADARGWTSSVGGIVKQCIQLSNLHSHLISEVASREGRFSTTVAVGRRDAFVETFRTLNSQRHPKRDGWFLEPADEAALDEFVSSGCELYGHSVMFEHLADEYMSYSGGGDADLAKARKVRALVYYGLF